MKKLLVVLACMALVACNRYQVSSPDGRMTLSFHFRNGQPAYSVACDGKDVLLPSPLGLVLTNGQDTLRDLKWTVLSVQKASADTTWETVWGEERFIRYRHNEMKVCLKAHSLRMNLIFRVFDDGFAFRYAFPKQETGDLTVLDEQTGYVYGPSPGGRSSTRASIRRRRCMRKTRCALR